MSLLVVGFEQFFGLYNILGLFRDHDKLRDLAFVIDRVTMRFKFAFAKDVSGRLV